MQQVIADYRTAKINESLRAMLGFLEKLTLDPDEVGTGDVEKLRYAELTDDHIEDAAAVCALFNTYVRLADTFGFDIPPAEGFRQSADTLLGMGYDAPPPLKWFIPKKASGPR
jgi:hypothetical protein